MCVISHPADGPLSHPQTSPEQLRCVKFARAGTLTVGGLGAGPRHAVMTVEHGHEVQDEAKQVRPHPRTYTISPSHSRACAVARVSIAGSNHRVPVAPEDISERGAHSWGRWWRRGHTRDANLATLPSSHVPCRCQPAGSQMALLRTSGGARAVSDAEYRSLGELRRGCATESRISATSCRTLCSHR